MIINKKMYLGISYLLCLLQNVLKTKNISLTLSTVGSVKKWNKSSQMDKLKIIKDGGMAVGEDGKIKDVGKSEYIIKKYEKEKKEIIDLKMKKAIIPGLVDSHTHSIFAGDRINEFEMKIKGATYMEIHKKGGGIGYT
ncbi:putative imidazolonepropionase, partial [Reticulomyxa filosa]